MSKISTKEIIICIITIIVLILSITTNVFADNITDLLGNTNKNNDDEYENIFENKNANKNNINTNKNNVNANKNNVNANKNNINTNKNNTSMPDAGLDQSIVFIIAIFGVSAIYAYKKISDYKNV